MSKEETVMQRIYRFTKLPDTEQKGKIELAYLMDKVTQFEFFQLVDEYIEQVEEEDEQVS